MLAPRHSTCPIRDRLTGYVVIAHIRILQNCRLVSLLLELTPDV
jgi:hypothetical protein